MQKAQAQGPLLEKLRLRNRRGQVKIATVKGAKPVTTSSLKRLPGFQDMKDTPFPNPRPLPPCVLRQPHWLKLLLLSAPGQLASAEGAAAWLLQGRGMKLHICFPGQGHSLAPQQSGLSMVVGALVLESRPCSL